MLDIDEEEEDLLTRNRTKYQKEMDFNEQNPKQRISISEMCNKKAKMIDPDEEDYE
jgi:hypothetical protein